MATRTPRAGIYYRMARFEQYNLHPERNRHYQSGRQRDPWHIRERMVMVPVPTDHVDIDVQFDIYDTVEKNTVHTTPTALPLHLKTLMTS